MSSSKRRLITLAALAALLLPSPAWAAQFARPASDINNPSAYTPTPLWQQLDEVTADDDTTTVSSGNNPATAGDSCSSNTTGFKVGLSAVTDPVSSVGHVARARGRQTTGARNITLFFLLCQGTTTIANWNQDVSTNKGVYFDINHTLTGAEADAITDYSNLSILEGANTVGGGSPSQAVITWMELEVPDAGPPPPCPQTLKTMGVGC